MGPGAVPRDPAGSIINDPSDDELPPIIHEEILLAQESSPALDPICGRDWSPGFRSWAPVSILVSSPKGKQKKPAALPGNRTNCFGGRGKKNIFDPEQGEDQGEVRERPLLVMDAEFPGRRPPRYRRVRPGAIAVFFLVKAAAGYPGPEGQETCLRPLCWAAPRIGKRWRPRFYPGISLLPSTPDDEPGTPRPPGWQD